MPDLNSPLKAVVCEGLGCASAECDQLIAYYEKLDSLGMNVAEELERARFYKNFCSETKRLFFPHMP